jgi:hypothetical protein
MGDDEAEENAVLILKLPAIIPFVRFRCEGELDEC